MFSTLDEAASFHEDMIRIIDRLPSVDEYRRIRHLVLARKPDSSRVDDSELARVLIHCPHLETAVLSGVPDITDRTIVLLATHASNLQGLDISGCSRVTDVGILELMTKSLLLQWIQLNGVAGLRDPSISAIAKSCSRLTDLGLSRLPLVSPLSVRDIWSFSR